jgi:Domain of unknown function (DUF4190)
MTQEPSIGPPAQASLPTSGMAIASLVTGMLGFMGPLVFSIAALITGYTAHKETRAVPPRAGGDGFATVGIIMGWVQIGLVFFAICIGLALLLLGIGVWGSLRSR